VAAFACAGGWSPVLYRLKTNILLSKLSFKNPSMCKFSDGIGATMQLTRLQLTRLGPRNRPDVEESIPYKVLGTGSLPVAWSSVNELRNRSPQPSRKIALLFYGTTRTEATYAGGCFPSMSSLSRRRLIVCSVEPCC
jgi:hypothetical protein